MTFGEFVVAAESLESGEDTWFHFVSKAKVSVEVEKPGREGLDELAALADVVFYSRSWAEVRRPSPTVVSFLDDRRNLLG
ncbi:hypothetical protein F5Y19DRAFT_479689 [Xylariaceae sp. FL1651]|nr:hypothetical protein F5Y19DRAFT_479689 [Xylariaceae sp. FL1651]